MFDGIAGNTKRLNIVDIIAAALRYWDYMIGGQFDITSTAHKATVSIPITEILPIFIGITAAIASFLRTSAVFSHILFGPMNAIVFPLARAVFLFVSNAVFARFFDGVFSILLIPFATSFPGLLAMSCGILSIALFVGISIHFPSFSIFAIPFFFVPQIAITTIDPLLVKMRFCIGYCKFAFALLAPALQARFGIRGFRETLERQVLLTVGTNFSLVVGHKHSIAYD